MHYFQMSLLKPCLVLLSASSSSKSGPSCHAVLCWPFKTLLSGLSAPFPPCHPLHSWETSLQTGLLPDSWLHLTYWPTWNPHFSVWESFVKCFVLVLRVLKICSLSNFQRCNTVLLTIVAMLYITSLWLTYFVSGNFCLLIPFSQSLKSLSLLCPTVDRKRGPLSSSALFCCVTLCVLC